MNNDLLQNLSNKNPYNTQLHMDLIINKILPNKNILKTLIKILKQIIKNKVIKKLNNKTINSHN